MDLAARLSAIDRCLKSPVFQKGDVVQNSEGCLGTVLAGRLSVTAQGIGNEFEVRWEDGQTCWVEQSLITLSAGTERRPVCASMANSSTT
jgi:hypothetical protein